MIPSLSTFPPFFVPIMQDRVPAGFPSPAADGTEDAIDLNRHLIARPAATFIVRISGDSMTGAGILGGDLAVVDRSLSPRNGDIVVAAVNGAFTLKRFLKSGGMITLAAENPAYPPLRFSEETEMSVWGVVTAIIRQLRKA